MELFPDHARVAFLGDSITHANNFVTRVIAHYLTYFPEKRITFRNAGVSGGSAASSELFLEDDLLPFEPTHVLIMLGVNDSRRDLLSHPQSKERDDSLEDAYQDYVFRMERLVKNLLSRGLKVILCTPAPYAEFFETGESVLPGGHALILRYAEAVRALASSLDLPVVDFHARLSELYLDEPIYNPDRIHPNDRGQWRMAECILRAQGLRIDPYEPLETVTEKAGLADWAAVTNRVRNLFATEWMLVRDYSAPLERKKEIMEDYVAHERWNGFLYFEKLSRDYLKDKPIQTVLEKEVDRLMDERVASI